MPSAAGQIWPHLPSSARSEIEQRRASSLGEAMWPRPKPKPPNPYRESLLRNLRETRMTIQQEKRRNG
jgi:hypothetical protein